MYNLFFVIFSRQRIKKILKYDNFILFYNNTINIIKQTKHVQLNKS